VPTKEQISVYYFYKAHDVVVEEEAEAEEEE